MKKMLLAFVVSASLFACSTPETKTKDAAIENKVGSSSDIPATIDTLKQAEIAIQHKGMEAK